MEKIDDIIKEKLVNMLEMVHNLCDKNGIPYYIIGGTQLGAVRHKGFIPWDDDIDIGIPRPFYQKFINLCKKELKENYAIDQYKELKNGKKYYFYYSKVRDNSIKVKEDKYGKDGNYSGIWIDVFAIDGIPSSKIKFIEFKLKRNILKTLRAFSQIDYIRKQNTRSKIQKVLISFAKITNIGNLINQEKLAKVIEKNMIKNDFNKSTIAREIYGCYGDREFMKKDIFGKPTLYNFERLKVYGVEDYNEYLTHMYGDYMTPPPEEKRIPSHYKDVIIEK